MSSIIFHKLFRIKVTHEYFEDLSCNDLCLVPTIDTEVIMKNFGIIFKQSESGAILAQEVEKNNGSYSQKIPFDEEITLRFYLTLLNQMFFNYSDMEYGTHAQSIYYFNNQNPAISSNEHTIIDSSISAPIRLYNNNFKVVRANNAKYIILEDLDGLTSMIPFRYEQQELLVEIKNFQSGKYLLKQYDASHSVLSSNEIYIDNYIFSETPFGVFEVAIDETYDLNNPVDFIFSFKSRSVIWRYKIFKKDEASINGNSGPDPVIEHDESGSDKINFTSPTGTEPIVVNSTTAIKLKETGIENINLKKNNEILISNLPNASASSLKKEGSDWLSEIYVYYYV